MSGLIQKLSSDLRPFKKADTPLFFWMKNLGVFVAITLLSAALLPLRDNFPIKLITWSYHLENGLWLMLTVLSLRALYLSAFPESKSSFPGLTLLMIAVLFLLALLTHSGPASFLQEFELWRGGCGLLISLIAVLYGAFLFVWTRHLAPANAALSGLHASMASGSLGCLFMQIACAHDNSFHLVLWHFIPLFLLTLFGRAIAVRLFRW